MRRTHQNYDRGPSGMFVEHLEGWIVEAQSEEKPYPSRWNIVVEIIRLKFETGYLETECTWDTVVLLPKVGGG